MKESDQLLADDQLAARLVPLMHELMDRLVIRGEAGRAARVVHLLTYVASDFGKPKTLADTKTRPLFDGSAAGARQ